MDFTFDRFNIKFFINTFPSFQYWDLSKIIYGNVNLYNPTNFVSGNYITKFSSCEDLVKEIQIKEFGDTAFLMLLPLKWKNRQVLKLFFKSSLYLVNYEVYGTYQFNYNDKIKIFTNFSIFKNYIKSVLYKLYKFYFKFSDEYEFEISNLKKSSAKHVFRINSFDYELYLEGKDCLGLNYEYILYLDEFYPFHPDFKLNGFDLNKSLFKKKINIFFEFIEFKYKIPVVIALHPKSNYVSNYFNNRIQIHGQTHCLVKNASKVLTHSSASVNFSLLYQKPLLAVNFNEFKFFPSLYEGIQSKANFLKVDIVDIESDLVNSDFQFKVPESYNYLDEYVRSSDNFDDLRNYEILNSIFN